VELPKRLLVEPHMRQHVRTKRLLVHFSLGMPPNMEVNALIIVDRDDAHPKIFVRISDSERSEHGRHSDMRILSRIVSAAQRRVLKAKIGIVDLDARSCVESHFGCSSE